MRLIAVALISVLPLGCSDSTEPERVEVSGHVTLGGKPLPRAMIRFVAIKSEPGLHDSVTMISEGHFAFDSTNGPSPGEHHVMITPMEPEMNEAVAAIQNGERDPLNARSIPARYQSTGQLRATIDAANVQPLTFELTKR
ncbi:putative secreted membrane lipoprotein [Rhodopirellula islandica]|uniref:Secreted membrane lipoprotein n=2 Tax=Rhodopirellula islandica TaxID=595434 RepID=A0A0J1B7C6_RHOIS|nr:putative secreted membrane lipoprotein [Rhodopirellula islandica]